MALFPGAADADQQLSRLLAHLETAQHVAQVGSWDQDLVDGRLEWSSGVYDILGCPSHTTPDPGRFLSATHVDDRTRLREEYEGALAGRTPYSIDHRIVRPDGTVRHVHQEAEVVRDATGTPVRLVGVIEDRTERVLTEERLAEIEAKRRELLHRMLHTMDEERSRLASALHDDPIQQLTIAALRLEYATMTSEQPLPVDDLVSGIHGVIEDLRAKLVQLEPLSVRIAGLRVALEHLAQSTLGDLAVSIVDDLPTEPPEPVTRTLVRIAQEALTNIRDHAYASRAEIHLAGDDEQTELRISDDGRGFDSDHHRTDVQRLGLVGMEERAAAAGGSTTFESGPSGTTIRVRLPHP